MLCTPQTPSNGGAPPTETLWDHLVAFASAPGVLEATLSIGLVGGFVFVWWRLAGLVQNVRERAALTTGAQDSADGTVRRAEELIADYESKLTEARAEAASIREGLRSEGQADENRIVSAAREQAMASLAGKRESLERDVAAATGQLEERSNALSQAIVARVLS